MACVLLLVVVQLVWPLASLLALLALLLWRWWLCVCVFVCRLWGCVGVVVVVGVVCVSIVLLLSCMVLLLWRLCGGAGLVW